MSRRDLAVSANQFCPRVPKDALECMVASNPSVLGFGLLNQAPISAIP